MICVVIFCSSSSALSVINSHFFPVLSNAVQGGESFFLFMELDLGWFPAGIFPLGVMNSLIFG